MQCGGGGANGQTEMHLRRVHDQKEKTQDNKWAKRLVVSWNVGRNVTREELFVGMMTKLRLREFVGMMTT